VSGDPGAAHERSGASLAPGSHPRIQTDRWREAGAPTPAPAPAPQMPRPPPPLSSPLLTKLARPRRARPPPPQQRLRVALAVEIGFPRAVPPTRRPPRGARGHGRPLPARAGRATAAGRGGARAGAQRRGGLGGLGGGWGALGTGAPPKRADAVPMARRGERREAGRPPRAARAPPGAAGMRPPLPLSPAPPPAPPAAACFPRCGPRAGPRSRWRGTPWEGRRGRAEECGTARGPRQPTRSRREPAPQPLPFSLALPPVERRQVRARRGQAGADGGGKGVD
jgi:hypothetical protein